MRRMVVAAMVIGITLAACNAILGIEAQATRVLPDEAGDGFDASEASVRPLIEPCMRDVDCVAPNGCYTPHCDTVLGACTYALCEAKDRTCARGVCNTTSFACSDPLPYGFLATSYEVDGVTSGCGPKPESCVAAAFPFVFIGTRDDVVALRADDLTGKMAVKVPVTGLTTKPQQVIASGRRIWVLGAVEGTVPPYKLPVATIDVPSDPTVTDIVAHTTIMAYSFPSAIGFPAPNGALFIAYDDATQGTPTALVQAPIPDGTILGLSNAGDAGVFEGGAPTVRSSTSMFRVNGVPPGATIVASSGERVVLYRYPSTFNLVAAAGKATASLQGDLPLNPPLTSLYGPSTTSFAQGPDGTVMMTGIVAVDPPADCNCRSDARLEYVLPNAIATTTDVGELIDPEGWMNPQIPLAMCHQCSPNYEGRRFFATWLDHRTALTAAPASAALGARNVTDVRLLGRDPFDANPKRSFTTKPTDMPKGEFGVDRIALTSSNGIGYVVFADGQGNNLRLSIVDPACDRAPTTP